MNVESIPIGNSLILSNDDGRCTINNIASSDTSVLRIAADAIASLQFSGVDRVVLRRRVSLKYAESA